MPSAQAFTSQFPALALGLDPAELSALLDALEVEEVAAGETLITEGTPTDTLYLIWSGRLNVVLATPTTEMEIAELGAGDVLGEVSLIDPGPATATVRAEQGCVVLALSRERLEALWRDQPRVAGRFLRFLALELAPRIRSALTMLNRTHAGVRPTIQMLSSEITAVRGA